MAPIGHFHPPGPQSPPVPVPVVLIPAPAVVSIETESTDSNDVSFSGPLQGLVHVRNSMIGEQPSSSTDPNDVSFSGPLQGLVHVRNSMIGEQPSSSTETSVQHPPPKVVEQERNNSLNQTPVSSRPKRPSTENNSTQPGISPELTSKPTTPALRTHQFRTAKFFGQHPTRIHDFAYPKTGYPPPPEPLTPEEAEDRKVRTLEIQKARKQAEDQYAYRQGHIDRPEGENRRRERSADYDRRGDRLRKESPDAKDEERKERKRSASEHRQKLRGERQSSYSLFNLYDSSIHDVDFDSPGNPEKLARTLDADVKVIVGRHMSHTYDARDGNGHRSGRNRGFMANDLEGKTSGERRREFGIGYAKNEGKSKNRDAHKGKDRARKRR